MIGQQQSVLYCRSDTRHFIGCFDTSNMKFHWKIFKNRNYSVSRGRCVVVEKKVRIVLFTIIMKQ